MRKRSLSLIDPSRVFADSFLDAFMSPVGLDFQYTNDLEMYEEGDNLYVKFKAPGFKENDLDLTIEDQSLIIKAELKEEIEEGKDEKKYYFKQMRHESFTRSIALPYLVKGEEAEAEFKDGIVTIMMPKAEEAKPKRVNIKKKS